MLYIRDIVNAQRKTKTKLKRLLELKKYYLSMYRCYMIRLYDLGYIADPTRYNQKEIIQNIVDMGINDLFTYSGKVDLSLGHILFAKYCSTSGDASVFLDVLYNALRYREFSKTIDTIYEVFDYSVKDSCVIKITAVPKASKYTQKSGIKFNEAVGQCISTYKEETNVVNIREELWSIALEELGIEVKDCKKGIFDSRLSHDEEVECIEGILNGYFKVQGEASEKLKEWLMVHRWSAETKWKSDSMGLYDYIFSTYAQRVEKVITEKINKVAETGTVIMVDSDCIYYNTPKEFINIPYGVFSIVCSEGGEEKLLPDSSNIYGYTGEAYSLNRLKEDGIVYVGCPILINTSLVGVGLYYDIEQTDIQSKTWFGDMDDVSIEFEDEGFKKNPFSKSSLAYKLLDGYYDSQRNSGNMIKKIKFTDSNSLEKAKREVAKYIGG